jgi:preprotein translocase subunit YajC
VLRHIKPSFLVLAGLLLGLMSASGCASTGTEQSSMGSSWTLIIYAVVFGLIIYFLMIRPQRNKQKQQRKLLDELQTGDQVITMSGIYGEIDSQDEESMVIKVESGAKIRISKQSILGKRS